MRLSYPFWLFSTLCSFSSLALTGCGEDLIPPPYGGPADAGPDAPDGYAEAGRPDTSVPLDSGTGGDARADTGLPDVAAIDATDVADVRVVTDVSADVADADGAPALDAADTGADTAALTDARSDGPAGGTAYVRFAALSPDSDAVDFCVRAVATAGEEPYPWLGPLAKQLGAGNGLTYAHLSGYLPIVADTYEVRVVAGGSATCENALTGTTPFLDVPRFDAGTYMTLMYAGLAAADAQLDNALVLKAFLDDHVPAAAEAAVRIIHAAPGVPPVEVGLGTGEAFVPLTASLAYLASSRGSGFDLNGYLLTPPLSGQTLAIRDVTNGTEVLTVPGFGLTANTIRTVFAIAVPSSETTPVQLLSCDDLSTGPTTTCLLLRSP